MAEEAVQGILEGLKIAGERQARLIQKQLEQQRIDQQAKRDEIQVKQHEQLLKQREKEHNDVLKQQELANRIAEQFNKLRSISDKQSLIKNAESGVGIPGAPVIAQDKDYTTYQLPGESSGNPIPGLVGPGVDAPYTPARVRTPEKQAADEATLLEPKQRALQELEMMREAARLRQQAETERAADERSDAQIRSRESIAALNRASRNQGRALDASNEKSYNTRNKEITDIEKPITDRLTRVSNLKDTLDANSPAADPLIAPELLTVMAGGQSSGLRMSEAELSRIVGGTTNWQKITAAIGKWQQDPSKPFLVQPEQRKQIRDLINVVDSRLRRKQIIINSIRDEMIYTDDPKEHKKLVQKLRVELQGIDGGANPAAANLKPGEIMVKRKSDGKSFAMLESEYNDPKYKDKYDKVVQ